MKKKCVVDKCIQEGPRRCSACIASKVAKTVDNKNDLGLDCLTSSALETHNDVQGSSYQPSSKGDETPRHSKMMLKFHLEVQQMKVLRDLA